jgi:hypothetical protein
MKSLFTLGFVFSTVVISAQSTILITNTFQEKTSNDRAIFDQVVAAARSELDRSQHQHVFVYNCSGNGMHHTQGKENGALHLDSLSRGLIRIPLSNPVLKLEAERLIGYLAEIDFSIVNQQLDVHVFMQYIEKADIVRDFLKPLALSLDLLNVDGSLAPKFTIRLHTHFASDSQGETIAVESL